MLQFSWLKGGTVQSTRDKIWPTLTVEQKLDALHGDITTLFALVEESSHKNHMCVDAINILHAKLSDTLQGFDQVRKIWQSILS